MFLLNHRLIQTAVAAPRPRIVIVGAGFAGLAAARGLKNAAVDITLIDRRNYHLFQPLLYQVATAALSPADIAWPIRALLRDQRNVTVVMGRVSGVNVNDRAVLLEDGTRYHYDRLILATGARHTYFGHDEWEHAAPGLKKIDDATEIRRRILLAFEAAEAAMDMARHRELLTFAVVGAGPTGVEMAGAIAELAKRTLPADFRRIDTGTARVLLIEAGPRVLPALPAGLSARAQEALAKLGVEVLLGQSVTECSQNGIRIGNLFIPAATIVWAAGVMASPAGGWIGARTDRAGRVLVEPDLSVPGQSDIFVLGDTAAIYTPEGAPVPGVAPAAKQMGEFVARRIAGDIAGRPRIEPFRYSDAGSLATIGRNAAVARLPGLSLSGFPAWLLWAIAHVYFLIGTRNRVVVALNWAWTWVTHSRGARLITGTTDLPQEYASKTKKAEPAKAK
jgi:NADH dehydrogenase